MFCEAGAAVPIVQGILKEDGVGVRVGGATVADTSTSTEMDWDIPPPDTLTDPVYVPAAVKAAVLKEMPRLAGALELTDTLDADGRIQD